MSEASKQSKTVNGNKPIKNEFLKGNKPIKNKIYHSKTYGKPVADLQDVEMQMLETQKQPRVFNNDTQKSMCVKGTVGTSDDQISICSTSSNNPSVISLKNIRRKQNRNNKRRNLAKQNQDRTKTQFIEQTNKLDNLKSLTDVLALTIESQLFSITTLNRYWEKYSNGMFVSCPCGKKHYPFNAFCDLEQQVIFTYNHLFDLIQLSDDTPAIANELVKNVPVVSNDKVHMGTKTDSKSLRFPETSFSLTTDEDSDSGRPGYVYDVVSCHTPPECLNAPQSKKKSAAFAEQLISKLKEINVTQYNQNVKEQMSQNLAVKNQKSNLKKIVLTEDSDMGYFKQGKETVRRVEPNIAKALSKINGTYSGKEQSKYLMTPISRPVINNISKREDSVEYLTDDQRNRLELQEMDNGSIHEVIPTGFNLQYKPAFWQFWRHKSTFNSENQFNHDSHFVRRVAKTKNLDYTNLPDECVIDSLFSYLVRRRLPTYPNYNSKLEHLHKLAKAWENEEMPLSKNIANATQLNNYYLTIGKVANSTDIDLLLSQHHEDRLGRRARLFRWITGRTVKTIRED